jgi:hypothetical protein
MIQDRNEAKVIQDIARLIVPSAQSLAIRGAIRLKTLIESINEGWDNSIAVTKPRPQPELLPRDHVLYNQSSKTDRPGHCKQDTLQDQV